MSGNLCLCREPSLVLALQPLGQRCFSPSHDVLNITALEHQVPLGLALFEVTLGFVWVGLVFKSLSLLSNVSPNC